jgi:esterase/lipase superfamily enzyme
MIYLPCEIINYILEFANTGTELVYDYKGKCFVFRFKQVNKLYNCISNLYDGRIIDICTENDGYTQTQVSYNIGLRKVPSLYRRMNQFETASSYMVIVVEEDEDGTVSQSHQISSILSFTNGAILLG